MSLNWIPKKLKYKRFHKGRVKFLEYKKTSSVIAFGFFGLKILKNGRLPSNELEASRRMLSKHIRKKEKLWIRCKPNTPVTTKPLQIRMGKGKGSVAFWVYKMSCGEILYEIGFVAPEKARNMLTSASKKMSTPCTIVYKRI